MNKHTPGPWKADKDGWIETKTFKSVVEYEGCGSHSARWLNCADLNLVLAAPEMLQALESVLRLHENADLEGEEVTMGLVLNAIRKAKGITT